MGEIAYRTFWMMSADGFPKALSGERHALEGFSKSLLGIEKLEVVSRETYFPHKASF